MGAVAGHLRAVAGHLRAVAGHLRAGARGLPGIWCQVGRSCAGAGSEGC